MRATATTTRRTARAAKKSPASTPPRPGEGNPSWGRSYVTMSQYINWKESDSAQGGPGPVTFSAGPGQPGKRVTVSISELPYERSAEAELNLKIAMPTGMQVADGPITIEQALGFEEGVRAVFQAARTHGLLPLPARKVRR